MIIREKHNKQYYLHFLFLKIIIGVICVVSVLTAGNNLYAQTKNITQPEVKAVFLYNFVNFTEWKAANPAGTHETVIIGVLGENPFGTYLEEAVQGERKGGRPLTVKYFTGVDEIENCHVLFINHSQPEQLAKLLTALQGRHILTVSDAPDFIEEGGMIRFFINNSKVRFQINVAAVKNEGLEISSKLLRLAEIVNHPKQ